MYILLDNVRPVSALFRYEPQALVRVLDQVDTLALASIVRLQNERGQSLTGPGLPLVNVPTITAELLHFLGQKPRTRIERVLVFVDLTHHVQGSCQRAFFENRVHVREFVDLGMVGVGDGCAAGLVDGLLVGREPNDVAGLVG